MNNIQLVNSVTHKDTRIITRRSPEFGDNVMFASTFPMEFRAVQAHYPILFQKNRETGRFNPIALFGFEDEENLFLTEAGWSATYIPLMIQRLPFHIGYQAAPVGSSSDKIRVMHINMNSPRVSRVEGERLFLEQGGTTEYLDRMAAMLETMYNWSEHGKDFDLALAEHNLLEEVAFDITLDNGVQRQLLGFSTINEDALARLDGRALQQLQEKNYLQPIYMAIASISNINTLAKLKSRQVTI